ncbi:MAG: hypothetical protein FWE57_06525 [Chitinispirillia bacterium]|nr:hypothetical protein [Chitinispirillia bacterium]
MGRFHLLRVLVLIFAAGLLSWYARQGGNNPFAGTKTIRLAGNENGYALMCSAGKQPSKRIVTLFAPVPFSSSDNQLFIEELSGNWDLVTLSQSINFSALPRPPQSWTVLCSQSTQIFVDNIDNIEVSADSTGVSIADFHSDYKTPADSVELLADNAKTSADSINSSIGSSSVETYDGWPEPIFNNNAGARGRFFWQTVYPFSDSTHAVLLTVDRTTTLICGSSVLARSSKETRSQFKERLDLLIIPSADAKTVKEMREIFRPRFVAVMPPCDVSAKTHLQNVICADESENWEYLFKVKRGRLRIADQEQSAKM